MMISFRWCLAAGCLLWTGCVGTAWSAEEPAAADLIVVNAKVVTLETKQPEVSAFAVERNRIAALGDNDSIRRHANDKTHCADDGRWAEKRIGPGRSRGTYAFRSLLDADVVLAFGSDWNVAPLEPLRGIAAAVTRQTLDGLHPEGWVPEQKISRIEAVRAYTFGSAFAEFQEHDKGTLAPGKLADFVILSRDLFEIPVNEFALVRVLLTAVDGKVVFESGRDGKQLNGK